MGNLTKRDPTKHAHGRLRPDLEQKAESVFSSVSAVTEHSANYLPRTWMTRLMLALINSAGDALYAGPGVGGTCHQDERRRAFESAVEWLTCERTDGISLSDACHYLTLCGLNADETRIRRSWLSLIRGHAASRYVPSRRAVLVSPVTGASTTPSD